MYLFQKKVKKIVTFFNRVVEFALQLTIKFLKFVQHSTNTMKKATQNKINKLYSKLIPLCSELEVIHKALREERESIEEKLKAAELYLEEHPDNERAEEKYDLLDEQFSDIESVADEIETLYDAVVENLDTYASIISDYTEGTTDELDKQIKGIIARNKELSTGISSIEDLADEVVCSVQKRTYNEKEGVYKLLLEVKTNKGNSKPSICEFQWNSESGKWENTYSYDPLPTMRYDAYKAFFTEDMFNLMSQVYSSTNGENSFTVTLSEQ